MNIDDDKINTLIQINLIRYKIFLIKREGGTDPMNSRQPVCFLICMVPNSEECKTIPKMRRYQISSVSNFETLLVPQ